MTTEPAVRAYPHNCWEKHPIRPSDGAFPNNCAELNSSQAAR